MEANEQSERARVCAVARSFSGTPYHHFGMLKGIGVDCATLLVMVYREAGVVNVEDPASYSPQFFLHRSEEKYLAEILQYAHEITEKDAKPGDVVVWKIGRSFAHGAIIIDPGWPAIIHALSDAKMVIEDRGDGGRLADKERKFFSRW